MAKLFPDSTSGGVAPLKTVPLTAGNKGTSNAAYSETVTATGGTRRFVFNGQSTAPIAYNADAATIKAALVALSNVGPNDVTVTGTGPFIYTFVGAYAGTEITSFDVIPDALTGGTSTLTKTANGGLSTGVKAAVGGFLVREATRDALARTGNLKRGAVQNDLEKSQVAKPADIGDPARYNPDGTPKFR